MSSLAYESPLKTTTEPANTVLQLRSADEGWALIDQRGVLVFSAEGRTGRQACLAFARDHGVLALVS
jgi:hypothetical protein